MAEAPEDIFRHTYEAFRLSLSEDDRRSFVEFSDASSMLKTIEEQAKNHPIHSSLLTKCCKKVHSLSTKLTPYFEIVGILVQAHPEFAALAWGSIRLVFQLGSNHIVFLERICNMFENMAALLPAYEEYVKRLRSRAEERGNCVSVRLVSAMAYIYSDLIQFCFDAYKLLSRRKSKIMRLRGSFVHSLNWQPFDVRYDVLLRRWKEHQELMDLEMRVSSQVEQIEASKKLEEMLRRIEQRWGGQNEVTEKWALEEMERRLQILKDWICPPTWFGLFENAQNRRSANTTEWFLENSVVKCWLSQIEENSSRCGGLMTVQGKPGYGKTTLCTTLIEHLQKQPRLNRRNNMPNSRPMDLCFFYFDKQRTEGTQSSGAFRAILAQLLHIYANDKEVLDILTIIWNENQVGQQFATDREVLCALDLLSRRCRQLVLVFDGIDECVDQETFFKRLNELRQISKSLAIGLFNRPTINIPRSFAKDSVVLDLGNSQNHQDICTYLRPRVIDLIDYGILSDTTNIDDAVDKISSRANGMFLWVTLLMEYLQSPSLSSRQVYEAVSNLNRLQGLDSLYTAILEALEQQASAQAKANTARAFQMVAFSYRPLRVTELSCAMVIPLDRRLDHDDIIPNFAQNIRRISGALMEISDDERVRFIHLSVLEYLTDPKQSYFERKSTDLSTNAALAHHSCACFCLSYLYFTLPAEPLGVSSQITADRGAQTNRYPFLDYASEFWSRHLLAGIKAIDLSSTDQEGDLTDALVDLTSKFLTKKAAVTAWIEASWTFLHTPQIDLSVLDRALSETSTTPTHIDSRWTALVTQAFGLLRRLALDLKDLDSSWAQVLKENPNEIWEPSISAFIKSSFWVSVPGSKLTQFVLEDSDRNYICLKSQVSSDSLRLGVVKLCSSTRNLCSPEQIKISYEIWNIKTRNLIYQSFFEIPESEFVTFVDVAAFSNDTEKISFQLPTAISADLTTFVIPGLVARISEDTKPLDVHQGTLKTVGTQQLNMSLSGVATRATFLQLNPREFEKPYATQISKSGEILMILRRSSGLVELDSKHGSALWLAMIYCDLNFRSRSVPDYRYLVSVAFKPFNSEYWSDDNASENDAESIILLHPYLHMLGFKHRSCILRYNSIVSSEVIDPYHGSSQWSRNAETILWDFSCQGPKSLQFFQIGDQRVSFSDCGKFFCGRAIQANGTRRSISSKGSEHCDEKQRRWREPLPPLSPGSSTITRPWGSLTNSGGDSIAASPLTQDSWSLVQSTSATGELSRSRLHHLPCGAVVLQTLSEDKLMTSETLTKLPRWASVNCSVTLLRNPTTDSSGKETIQLVLNPAGRSFEAYEAQTELAQNDKVVPMILERKRETIETSYGRGSYSLGGGLKFQGTPRKRLGPINDGEVKRQKLLGPPKWTPASHQAKWIAALQTSISGDGE